MSFFHLHTATKGTLPLGAACKQMYATANDVNDRKDALLMKSAVPPKHSFGGGKLNSQAPKMSMLLDDW